jgi:flavin-dependent dehydrogenase
VAFCPRRTVLDKILVDAAAEAGAEIREGFAVEEILIEDGRAIGIKGRSKGSRREAPFAGAAVANFFRKPDGPGWALVGDAGYNEAPITAQGITDAFRDAERCAVALDEAFTGARSFDAAMRDYQRDRDEQVLPWYEFTCQLAALQPPPPETQSMLGAIQGNQTAMDGFAQMNAGTISPAEFGAIVAPRWPRS